MSFFTKLPDAFAAFWAVLNDDTPESHIKGIKFESFVGDVLFPKKDYDLVDVTHDYWMNKDRFVESSYKPDFRFRDKKTGKDFYVECKFRTGLKDGKYLWTNEKQFVRYNDFKDAPVFLALGFVGHADYPDRVFFLKLEDAKWVGLYLSHLEKFEIPKKPVLSSWLWSL
jgi:hypothetical protein